MKRKVARIISPSYRMPERERAKIEKMKSIRWKQNITKKNLLGSAL